MRAPILLIAAIAFLSGSRCSLPWTDREAHELTIISYNAHNLFDDVENGNEYPEYSMSSGKWDADRYGARLENTAAAILSFFPEGGKTPDVICLQELESEKTLTDLARGALKKGGYRWIALGGPAGSAIKCGIISRHPFTSLKAHSLADAWGFGPGRDILEASFDLGSGAPGLTLFVCHWKSRREGPALTEVARRAASEFAARRIAEIVETDPERCIVVCGDFNESPDEFKRTGKRYPTALMPDPDELSLDRPESADPRPFRAGAIPDEWFEGVLRVSGKPSGASLGEDGVTLYSPWSGDDGFSYVFDGKGERLDGFLLSPALLDGKGPEFVRFMVSADPALLDEKGEPKAWNGSSGFSDHLPIALTIALGEER
ncbi:MAG TPA: endonuclease/exonuclease/phosphatase family protein [Rectinemataceae bacterium]|nr:endonuclease/exonuclease/phosphatase family protein [Rectinemataceae bacterium]